MSSKRLCKHGCGRAARSGGNQCFPCNNDRARYGVDNVAKVGTCELCGKFGQLHVDHKHSANGCRRGPKRGMLCRPCNTRDVPFVERFETREEMMAFIGRICAYLGVP